MSENEIPFTQYLRPSGTTRQIRIERSKEVYEKAMRIIDAGFVFEAEALGTGICSFTITDREEEEDVAIELCPNGPKVLEAIDKLVNDFELKGLNHVREKG